MNSRISNDRVRDLPEVVPSREVPFIKGINAGEHATDDDDDEVEHRHEEVGKTSLEAVIEVEVVKNFLGNRWGPFFTRSMMMIRFSPC